MRCNGCGKELLAEAGDVAWDTSHLDSTDSMISETHLYHCIDCDPLQIKIAYFRGVADALEQGAIQEKCSPAWQVIQGLS
jgi:hypothetical protein